MNLIEQTRIAGYGSTEPLPTQTLLRAGRLSLVYEQGFIRYIRVGDIEVLRMVNHAVRDHNWGTVPLTIEEEEIQTEKDSFSIRYRAVAQQGDIRFQWNCRIEGRPNHTLSFSITGEALSTFKRNRVGFTLLHPIAVCAGNPVRILHSEGGITETHFPQLISPHQPFFDIRGMEWELGDLGTAQLEFKGDIFETEDQRNWIDDSYKTYCTPLALPFPIQLNPGDRVNQEIHLSFLPHTSEVHSPTVASSSTFSLSSHPHSLPRIGLGQSSESEGFTTGELDLLKELPFYHYQVDLKLYEENWQQRWIRAVGEVSQLGRTLELSLFFDDIEQELPLFEELAKGKMDVVTYLNVFNKSPHATQRETVAAVLPSLKVLGPHIQLGAGTNAFFTELNRDRTPTDQLDYLVFSINPQVHAFDNASLVENLNAISYTVETARDFGKQIPIHISPISLKMRWNPNATGEQIILPGQLPDTVDPRQMSLFGATWTLGCINELIKSRVEAASLYETIGTRGIIQSATPQFPHIFYAPPQSVYPVYFVLKTLLNPSISAFYPIQSTQPLVYTGIAFRHSESSSMELILGNFSDKAIQLPLPGTNASTQAKIVDTQNVSGVMEKPQTFEGLPSYTVQGEIHVPPFGLAWIQSITL